MPAAGLDPSHAFSTNFPHWLERLADPCGIADCNRTVAPGIVVEPAGQFAYIVNAGVFSQLSNMAWNLWTFPPIRPRNFFWRFSIHPDEHKDLTSLRSIGWRVLDSQCVAGTPRQYLNFVGASKAEFGIAKSGYAAARCGWFSDRSACYLAFGRPVVAQETGFSDFLPCGEGLFCFRTPDDVLAAIETINGDYARQSKAASEIAREYFESGKVLSSLMTTIGLC
jgi:hypothetical protein